jgi:putative holliday junction resolvase
MNSGRILAIDYGERRIGLALSDPMRIIASGLTTLEIKSDNEAVEKIKSIITEHEIVEIVLGNPLDKSGAEGAKTAKVRAFAEKLQKAVSPSIILWDERMSSVTAQKMLIETESKKKRRTKEKIDELAAVVILRHYLDAVIQKRSTIV